MVKQSSEDQQILVLYLMKSFSEDQQIWISYLVTKSFSADEQIEIAGERGNVQ